MKIKIRKRDSRLVDFDKNRIIDAVLAAFKEVDGEITDYALEKSGNIADYILHTIRQKASDRTKCKIKNCRHNQQKRKYCSIFSCQKFIRIRCYLIPDSFFRLINKFIAKVFNKRKPHIRKSRLAI